MGVIPKKDFAELCGLPTNKLWSYVQRGKIILLSDGMIDVSDPRNKAFLEKRKGRLIASNPEQKQEKTRTKSVIQAIIPETTDLKDVEIHEGQSYTESERQLKYLDTLKRRKEIEKLEIDIQKKRGEVVPSDLIKPVFLQHNQSILTAFKNATDEILRIFGKKRSLSVNESAEIKTELVNTINLSIAKAIEASIKSVEIIIEQHSEARGIGNHD